MTASAPRPPPATPPMSARWWPRRVIVQLRSQQADLIRQEADLSSKYGPLHPKLVAVQAQKRELDSQDRAGSHPHRRFGGQ